jgi:hypothetical protein
MPQQPTPFRSESWSASLLRRDLSERAHHLACTQNLLHDTSTGPTPVVIFGHDEQGRHGNFHPASYTNICANPAWQRRLAKVHTASRRSRARKDWQWMELDSCNSSDALLMNIFCHPGVFNGTTLATAVANLLNIDPATQPCFGINPHVPLKTIRARKATKSVAQEAGKNLGAQGLDSETWVLEPAPTSTERTLTDRTEIDLQLGNLFVEAKLTESNFQTAAPRLIERYRDLETVFDLARLPRKTLSTPPSHPPAEDYSQLEPEADTNIPGNTHTFNTVILSGAKNPRIFPAPPPTSIQALQPTQNNPKKRTLIQGYQLLRNVLAAYAADASFCVLCDARRHDLIETWYAILSAVHRPTFATRLKLLTWQELASALPADLQHFLETKYGILPA